MELLITELMYELIEKVTQNHILPFASDVLIWHLKPNSYQSCSRFRRKNWNLAKLSRLATCALYVLVIYVSLFALADYVRSWIFSAEMDFQTFDFSRWIDIDKMRGIIAILCAHIYEFPLSRSDKSGIEFTYCGIHNRCGLRMATKSQ